MPILAPEVSVYPEDLLESDSWVQTERAEPALWSVFHTRPRQEKAVARELLGRQIAYYLPTVFRRLLVRGRPVRSHVPLFPGYVFVRATQEQRLRVLSTHRVAHVLPVKNPHELLSDLRRVKSLIDTGAPLTVESRWEPGQPVRVRRGALEGLEGIVRRRKNATRLVVWVRMLQQGVALEIEDVLLEPLN